MAIYVSDVVIYRRPPGMEYAELVRLVNFVLRSPETDAGTRAVAGGAITIGVPVTYVGEPFADLD